MKAFMSKKLEAIINSPQGHKILRKGLLKLNAKRHSNEGTEIHVGDNKYKLQFATRKPATDKA